MTSRNGVLTNYAFDASSELTRFTCTWNARNQLVAISGAVSASFQYDPRGSGFVLANPELKIGRRVGKTIGATTQFLYDGANPVQELSGSSASANLLTGGVDEYFQRTDSAGARNFLTDALGSTLALADSAGALQTQYTFEPFGNTTVTGAPTTNTFAFTGRELDSSGLYFYRARYYFSALGRFVSEDPLGFGGGDVNLYAYAGDDPIDFADPLGLYSWGEFLGDSSNVIAGAGDTLSFGLSAYARNQWGDFFYGNTPRAVNTCSGSYKIGIGAGVALSTAIGGGAGFEEGVEREAGEEWSHWIPDRARQGRGGWIPDFIVNSDLNGQYVSDLEHALNDDDRMLKGMTLADKNPAWLQQLNRIPPWVTGAGGGAAYGGASSTLAGRNCGCR